ncbi:RES family NAD+ phosphorylase [Daejeonella sp.]|uniref:RES family NAD+ phosphorylase n=1 Tax=Daejeonella sp. TaxID=2805397 RepID=UPI003C7581CE
MHVYRISQTKYSRSLNSPGLYGRWNSEGMKVLYTGGSAALSCLEVAVHRSGASLTSGDFSVTVIDIPDSLKIEEVPIDELTDVNPDWYKPKNSLMTQYKGDEWLKGLATVVLKVPSAIIQFEYNYLLNVEHPDFSKISIYSVNPFKFVPRLKIDP